MPSVNTSSEALRRQPHAALPWLAAIAFFMQTLDTTILNTVLPAIAGDLHRSALEMGAAVIGYALTVAMRVLQGGGALMMPVARMALLPSYPRSEYLAVISTVATQGLLGPVLGPLLGGWLVTQACRHWIFLINLPIGLLMAPRVMPEDKSAHRVFDAGFSRHLRIAGRPDVDVDADLPAPAPARRGL